VLAKQSTIERDVIKKVKERESNITGTDTDVNEKKKGQKVSSSEQLQKVRDVVHNEVCTELDRVDDIVLKISKGMDTSIYHQGYRVKMEGSMNHTLCMDGKYSLSQSLN
jgi:hypothetical protein